MVGESGRAFIAPGGRERNENSGVEPGPTTAILQWLLRGEGRRGCTQEKEIQNEGPQPHGWSVEVGRTVAQPLSSLWLGETSAHGVQGMWLVQEPRCNRSRIIARRLDLPVSTRHGADAGSLSHHCHALNTAHASHRC